ncbi:hypothetical protein BDV95DRAFT_606739 [Massariosphaeria phaeospora]|uniref:Xylanolytic transcriptional activator regulatory domain-containing protein n=1 Tax=Massariosphaeria phaeospora TaxID=100035 RepID=A0A7C8MFQ0_9PLEO|nr:hypothetical protein BDV95DRAFT_606739 [Massariosphaeria phaeospora]
MVWIISNRIAEYESRIQELESLLQERSAAQPQVEQPPMQPADQLIPLSTWVSNLRSEVDSLPVEEGPYLPPEGFDAVFDAELEGLDEEVVPQLMSGTGIAQTSLEDAVPRLLDDFEPSTEFQEDAAYLQSLPLEESLPGTIPDIAAEPPTLVAAVCDAYLPPPELGTSLLKDFLVDFNTAIPLYRPYVIAEHLRICYIGESDGTAISWVSAYVVFGIAHRLRAMSATATPKDNDMADYYLARILAQTSDLLLAPPSLGLVQCLLGLATLIQTSAHSTPHALFVSTALRMAQSLAYNDDAKNPDPDADVEQQRRVFCLAFIRDTNESILSNAPATSRREDIAASHPEAHPQDFAGAVNAAETNWSVNIFSLRARLALLQAEAIEHVFSLKARSTTPEAFLHRCNALLGRLQCFRNHELFELSAAHLMLLLYRSDLVHVLSLEAAYFATVFRIQADIDLGMDTRVNPFSTDALVRLADRKEHAVYEQAKRFLSLLAVGPQGEVGIFWTIKLPAVAALVVVLAHYTHAADAPSHEAMREYSTIIRTFETLVQKSRDAELRKATDLCVMLFSRVETGSRVKWLQSVAEGFPRGTGRQPDLGLL